MKCFVPCMRLYELAIWFVSSDVFYGKFSLDEDRNLFLSALFFLPTWMLLKWCQNISCCLLSNFTKRIVIIEMYLNRRKAKDLRLRLLQSPHRDRAIAGLLPPGMWQTDEDLKMNLQLNLHSLMKPLAAPYRSAPGSSKRNRERARHKRSV